MSYPAVCNQRTTSVVPGDLLFATALRQGATSEVGENVLSVNDSYQTTTSQPAEKLATSDVLKGHSFSCAVPALYFFVIPRGFSPEGSAFLTFSNC
jgi:hypothetical protein